MLHLKKHFHMLDHLLAEIGAAGDDQLTLWRKDVRCHNHAGLKFG